MTAPKMRNRTNWKLTRPDMETPKGTSETIPNHAFSIQELLDRFTQGLPLNQGHGFFADGDDEPDIDDLDLEEFNRLDITEREAIVEEMREKVERQKQVKIQGKKEPKKDLPKEDLERD